MTQHQYRTIWHLQSAQLAMLNWQVHQQQQLAAWQANLHQALHETEQIARRVSATITPDLFAAAVLSRSWMQRVHGIGPQTFNDIGAKRSWSDAFGVLDGAARAAANDERFGASVERYLQLMGELATYHSQFQGNPDAYIAHFRKQHQALSKAKNVALVVAGMAFALFVALSSTKGSPFGGIMLIVAIAFGVWGLKTRGQRRGAAKSLAQAEACVRQYHDFQVDPARGQWLQQMWAEHRLLFEVPPPVPVAHGSHAGSQVYVERKVVERQIVVVKCQYCRQLTPVDQAACQHCGAPGFGSSQ